MYTGLWDMSLIPILLFNIPLSASVISWLGEELLGMGEEKCLLAMLPNVS